MALEQHAIPTEVTKYEFHLVGDWTIKQFAWLAGGIIIAIIFFSADWLPAIIRTPAIIIFPTSGALIAFVPIQGRPLDRWLIAFIKAIYAPTEFLWTKEHRIPAYFQTISKPVDIEAVQKTSKTNLITTSDIAEYLSSLDIAQTSNSADKLEQQAISGINKYFQNDSLPQSSIPNSRSPSYVESNNLTSTQATLLTTTNLPNSIASKAIPVPNTIISVPTPNDTISQQLNNIENSPTPYSPPNLSTNDLNFLEIDNTTTQANNTFTSQPQTTSVDIPSLPNLNSSTISQPETTLSSYQTSTPKILEMTIDEPSQNFKPINRPSITPKLEEKLTEPEITQQNQTYTKTEEFQTSSTLTPPDTEPQSIEPQYKQSEINSMANQQQPTSNIPIPQATPSTLTSSDNYSHLLPPTPQIPNLIAGLVIDQTNKPITNVILEIRNQQNQPIRAIKTNQFGHFTIATPLPAGQYTIIGDKDNYSFPIISFDANNQIISPITIIAESIASSINP